MSIDHADVGIDRKQMRRSLELASLPPDVFEAALADAKSKGLIPTHQTIMRLAKLRMNAKQNLDSLVAQIRDDGYNVGLTPESLQHIADAGFRGKNLALAIVATDIACDDHPLTLRGLFYRVVSAGFLPSTNKEHYSRLGRVMTRLRETGVVPFAWLVDNIRSSLKPSSWANITQFLGTVQRAYRKDFWSRLPEYVHVIVEKDAMAGVVEPVTRKYDVTLSPIRGYASLSFAHEIATTWNQIEKPIHVYYLGDFDPSGFDLERDIREKLEGYCEREFTWTRLGVNAEDFDDFDLLKLEPKTSDRRYRNFVKMHGNAAAELDAIPATEIRRRVEEAITSHIPQEQWEALQRTEEIERTSFNETLGKLVVASHEGDAS